MAPTAAAPADRSFARERVVGTEEAVAGNMVKMSSGKGVRKPLAAVGVVLADTVVVACITATVAVLAIRIAKKAAKIEALLES